MTATECRLLLATLGTQRQAAAALGVGLRTVARWCARGTSPRVDRLVLRLVAEIRARDEETEPHPIPQLMRARRHPSRRPSS